MTSAEPTAILTGSWSLYDLITEHNYMSHQEIYTGVEDLLRLRSDRGNYHLLNPGLRQCTLPGPHGCSFSGDALLDGSVVARTITTLKMG